MTRFYTTSTDVIERRDYCDFPDFFQEATVIV